MKWLFRELFGTISTKPTYSEAASLTGRPHSLNGRPASVLACSFLPVRLCPCPVDVWIIWIHFETGSIDVCWDSWILQLGMRWFRLNGPLHKRKIMKWARMRIEKCPKRKMNLKMHHHHHHHHNNNNGGGKNSNAFQFATAQLGLYVKKNPWSKSTLWLSDSCASKPTWKTIATWMDFPLLLLMEESGTSWGWYFIPSFTHPRWCRISSINCILGYWSVHN